jgi:hypothetical protein
MKIFISRDEEDGVTDFLSTEYIIETDEDGHEFIYSMDPDEPAEIPSSNLPMLWRHPDDPKTLEDEFFRPEERLMRDAINESACATIDAIEPPHRPWSTFTREDYVRLANVLPRVLAEARANGEIDDHSIDLLDVTAAYYVARWAHQPERTAYEIEAARAYLAQWPEGPQVD